MKSFERTGGFTVKNLFKAFLVMLFSSSVVFAEVIVLDFEGLDDQEAINDFYNGGTSQNGNSGTDFGVAFSGNTLSIIDADAGGTGNFGDEPSPDTVMFFLTGAAAIMNVAAGFDTGFSTFYSAVNQPGSLIVWSGLDGTGDILATLDLPITPSNGGDPNGAFSPFFPIGVAFDGIAMSVSFAGVQNQIAFDNVTFGDFTPGGVPEPLTLAIFGAGLLGLGMARRRRS